MNTPCRKAFTEKLLELAQKDKTIMVVATDSRGSVTLNDFAQILPEQFVEAGIAEQNAVGIGGGLASCGKTVFVCSPSPFLSGRSYEQVKIDAVYNQRNVKLVGVSGGVSYGTLGFSHHSLQDISVLRTLPGLTVLVPCDAVQTKALTCYMAETEGPMYMRMGRNAVEQVYPENETFTVGKAKQLCDGTDLTLLAMGELVWPCKEAAALLAKEGIHARVLDMFSIKPFDTEAVIKAARETRRLVTVEEHSILGGLGGAVCEVTAQHYPVPVKVIGAPDGHIVAGESPEVFQYYGWTPQGIADKVKDWISKGN